MVSVDNQNKELMYRLELLRKQRTLLDEILDYDRYLYGKGEELTIIKDAKDKIDIEILDLLKIMKEGV